MAENEGIFKRTRLAITERLVRITQELGRNTEDMRGMDHDGDMMDDPELFRLNQVRVDLLGEEQMLNHLLFDNPDIPTPESDAIISLGHSVSVYVKYPDGGEDKINVTIGSKLDQSYLNRGKVVSTDPDMILLSTDSPLVKALLGRRVNEEVDYMTSTGKGKLKVLNIGPSALTQEDNLD